MESKQSKQALIERARREIPALREQVAENLAVLRQIANGTWRPR